MKNLIITEEEKNRILGLHSLSEQFDTTLFDKTKKAQTKYEEWFNQQNFSDPMSMAPYTTSSGDTAESIVKKFKMRMDDFKVHNPNIGSGPIPVGTKVKIYFPDDLDYNVLPPNINN